MEHHECHVHFVLEKFKEIKFYAKLEKCKFHQTKMEFLCYIIYKYGICMDPHKVQTIIDWDIIAFVCDVQCFLGFANFYQRFIAHYSMIMTHSTCLN